MLSQLGVNPILKLFFGHMNRQTIRVIISLAIILLIGLVTTQIVWVQKAYQLQEEQIDYDITQALKRVAQQILIANNDSTELYDPVEQVSDDLFRVKIRESIQPYYLETLLANEFRNAEININFEYSLYDCFTDSVVFSNSILLSENLNKFESITPEMNWANDAHYFGVYFPNKLSKILAQMDFWIFSSILLLVISLFFAYTISIILKQKRLSEVKTDFINNMTHELKTPISTIALASKVLMGDEIGKSPERLKNYAEIIDKENNRLQMQVEKVLQIASLEKDKVDIKKEQLNIHKIIDDSIKIISLSVEEKGGKISSKLNAENFIFEGDEVHLANVFINILDNANKYSPVNPSIEIKTFNKSQNLIVEFKDQGIGIDPKRLNQIFEQFYRVPKGNIHDVKGFGLGLHYVKVILDYHKVKIEVESEIDKGTLIRLILPQ